MKPVFAGATNVSIDVRFVDDEGLPVASLTYATAGTVKASKGVGSDVTDTLVELSAVTDAHTDWGFIERGEGVYRLDLPDSLFSAVGTVTIRAETTDKRLIAQPIEVISLAQGLAGTNLDDQVSDATGAIAAFDPPTRSELTTDINSILTILGTPSVSVAADLNAVGTIVSNTDDNVTLILADTGEMQGDLADGGRLDLIFDATLADTNELQGDWANGGRLDEILDGKASQASVNTIDGIVDNILLDTNELQTDDIPGTLSTLAADVWAVTTRVLTAPTNLTTTDAAIPITAGGLVNADAAAFATGTTAAAVAKTCFEGTIGTFDALDTAQDAQHSTTQGKVDTAQADLDTITGDDGALLDTATTDVYHADIDLTIDEANTQDEYTVTWFKNGARVTSGITSPTIQVIKRADGTNLIASTAMTQIGSTGSYKKDEDTARTTAGESVLVIAGATIDGSARAFSRVLARDSSA